MNQSIRAYAVKIDRFCGQGQVCVAGRTLFVLISTAADVVSTTGAFENGKILERRLLSKGLDAISDSKITAAQSFRVGRAIKDWEAKNFLKAQQSNYSLDIYSN